MDISYDYVLHQATFVPVIEAATRDAVIEVVTRCVLEPRGYPPDAIAKATTQVIRRENQGSTGFGKGVAVPRGRCNDIKGIHVGWFTSGIGIDFAALDRAPVYIVCCVLLPEYDHEEHMRSVQGVVFELLVQDAFRQALRRAETANAMREVVARALEEGESGEKPVH